jgi:hypothetical protein
VTKEPEYIITSDTHDLLIESGWTEEHITDLGMIVDDERAKREEEERWARARASQKLSYKKGSTSTNP